MKKKEEKKHSAVFKYHQMKQTPEEVQRIYQPNFMIKTIKMKILDWLILTACQAI